MKNGSAFLAAMLLAASGSAAMADDAEPVPDNSNLEIDVRLCQLNQADPRVFGFLRRPSAQLVFIGEPEALVSEADSEITVILDGIVLQFREDTILSLDEGVVDTGGCLDISRLAIKAFAEIASAVANDSTDGQDAQLIVAMAASAEALEAAEAQNEETEELLASTERRLALAVLAQANLRDEHEDAMKAVSDAKAEQAALEGRLSAALAAQNRAEQTADEAVSEARRREALLATATAQLTEEEELNVEAQREVQLLNEQVRQLRDQVESLQTLLDMADEADLAADAQIDALGAQLNTVLARAAQAEVRARAAEEEAARLEAELEETAQ